MSEGLLNQYIIECYKVGNKKEKGYVALIDEVIKISTEAIEHCPRFENVFQACKFIKKYKLDKNIGVVFKPVKLSNAKGVRALGNQEAYLIIAVKGLKGEYIHFATKTNEYFSNPNKIGTCCWPTREEAQQFVDVNYKDEKEVTFHVLPLQHGKDYQWHGKKVDVEFGVCIVKRNHEKPTYWYNYEIVKQQLERKDQEDFAVLPAIRVITGKQSFIIGNQFGIGIHKLLNGGWPDKSHYSFEGEFYLNPDYQIESFDQDGYTNSVIDRNKWEMENFPQEYKRRMALLNIVKKSGGNKN